MDSQGREYPNATVLASQPRRAATRQQQRVQTSWANRLPTDVVGTLATFLDAKSVLHYAITAGPKLSRSINTAYPNPFWVSQARSTRRVKLFKYVIAGDGGTSWKEVGKGPLRILCRRPTTSPPGDNGDGGSVSAGEMTHWIVQKLETTPGGPGTRVILNLKIASEFCRVCRQSNNYVILSTVEEEMEVPVRYLFKVRDAAAAAELEDLLVEAGARTMKQS